MSKHILVVDDNDLLLPLMDTVLRMNGFAVTTASSGHAALEWCDTHGQPDLLLTDVEMPDIDGPMLYEKLHHQYPMMPVLFMSGAAAYDLDRSVTPLLCKPFGFKQLFAMIAASLLLRSGVLVGGSDGQVC